MMVSDSIRPFFELSLLGGVGSPWELPPPLSSEISPPHAYGSQRGAFDVLRISQILLQDGIPSDKLDTIRRIRAKCHIVLSSLSYLQSRGFTVAHSELITQQFVHGWAPLFQVIALDDEVYYWQNPENAIPRLKVYGDESGQTWADVGLKPLGQGSYKLAKEVLRITDIGVRLLVRYTPKHNPEQASIGRMDPHASEAYYQERFLREMKRELQAREVLQHNGKIPGILEIFSQKYLTGQRLIKTRFFAEKCDGNLRDLLYDARGKFRSLDHQQKQKLFCFCCNMIGTLGQIHARGVVHRDIKLDNIFILRNEVFVADFGFWGLIGEDAYSIDQRGKKKRRGAPNYMPPEVAYMTAPKNDPSMDMYSCGVVLLKIYDQKLSRQHDLLSIKTHDFRTIYLEYTQEYRKKDIETIQEGLRAQKNGIGTLISELIDTDPTNRPSAQDTYARLRDCLRP